MTTPEIAPVYRLMESQVEAKNAIDEVIALTSRELRVFDVSAKALRERDFGRPERIEAIRQKLHGDRNHRLRVVLHDLEQIQSELPRLITLLGQYSGQIAVHRTVGVACNAMDPLVIGDTAHFWHRLYIDHPRSVVSLHDEKAVQPLLERFEQIWESSELALSGGTLGL